MKNLDSMQAEARFDARLGLAIWLVALGVAVLGIVVLMSLC